MKMYLLMTVFTSVIGINFFTVQGKASYYGEHWTGRKTASGETFYADSLTCAHKTYKFGTVLKVTDLRTDSVIYVKVNDRLPMSSKFVVDLSYGCAKKLNFVRAGVIPVTLEISDTVPIKK